MTIPDSITSVLVKRCTGPCRRELPATSEYFHKKMSGKYGLEARCKECIRANQTAYNAAHRENRHTYNVEHRAEIAAYNAQNREKRRIYNNEHREERRAYVRSPQGKVVFAAARHRRRARKHNLSDTFTSADWQRALDYFGGCCAVCGRPVGLWHTIAADHWIPLSSPDCPGTVPTNIIPLCHGVSGCNNSKLNAEPTDWLVRKFGKRKAKKIMAHIETYFGSISSSIAVDGGT